MMRMRPSRSVYDTTKSRSNSDRPMLSIRGSVSECLRSSIVASKGSPNTVAASSKVTPCFCTLAAALSSSHSNSTVSPIPSRYRGWSWRQIVVALQSDTVFDARLNVGQFQTRVVRRNLLGRFTLSKKAQHQLHRDSHAADDRFSAEDLRNYR